MVNGLFVGVWGSSRIRAGVEGMKKCSICGKPALEVVEVCPECLQRAAVDPRQIKRLKQISSILSITAGTDTNIKECMESILDFATKVINEPDIKKIFTQGDLDFMNKELGRRAGAIFAGILRGFKKKDFAEVQKILTGGKEE